jgi:hypothetical protein
MRQQQVEEAAAVCCCYQGVLKLHWQQRWVGSTPELLMLVLFQLCGTAAACVEGFFAAVAPEDDDDRILQQ